MISEHAQHTLHITVYLIRQSLKKKKPKRKRENQRLSDHIPISQRGKRCQSTRSISSEFKYKRIDIHIYLALARSSMHPSYNTTMLYTTIVVAIAIAVSIHTAKKIELLMVEAKKKTKRICIRNLREKGTVKNEKLVAVLAYERRTETVVKGWIETREE